MEKHHELHKAKELYKKVAGPMPVPPNQLAKDKKVVGL
jgi:hypothetical protein